MRQDEWLDASEFPDDDDIEAFGYDSEPDYSPLTIGYVGDERPSFWTVRRIYLLIGGAIIVAILLVPLLLRVT